MELKLKKFKWNKNIFKYIVTNLGFGSYIGEGSERGMDFEDIYYLYFREVFLYIRSLSGDENIAEVNDHLIKL